MPELALLILSAATVLRQDEAGEVAATAPPSPPTSPAPPPRDLLRPESLDPSDPDYHLQARLRAQTPVPCLDHLPGGTPGPNAPGYVVRRAASFDEADERHQRITAEVEARYGCLAKQQRAAEKAEAKRRKAAGAERRAEGAARAKAEVEARMARKRANRDAVQRKRRGKRAAPAQVQATTSRPAPAAKPQAKPAKPSRRRGRGRGRSRTGGSDPRRAGSSPRAAAPSQTRQRTAATPTATTPRVKPATPSRAKRPTISYVQRRLYGIVTALAALVGASKRQASWARSRVKKVLERGDPTPGAGLHVLLALNKPAAFARPTDKTQQAGWAEAPAAHDDFMSEYDGLDEDALDQQREYEARYQVAADVLTPEPVAVLPISRADLAANDDIYHNCRVAEARTDREEDALWGDEGQASAVWALSQNRQGEALKTWRQQTTMEWGPKKDKRYITVDQVVRRSHIDALADLVYTPTEDPRRGTAHIRIRKGDVEVVPDQSIWASMMMGPGVPPVSELEPETRQLNGCVLPASGGVVLF